MKYLTSIAALLLIIGCFVLPIGYYTFLRLAVFTAAIVVVIADRKDGVNISSILFVAIEILFNPIFPVYLHSKIAWTMIDAIVALLFAYKTCDYYRREKYHS